MDRAILLVSYGAANQEIWVKSIGVLKKEIQYRFKEWDVFEAFTGRRIIEKWKEQDLEIWNEREALTWLKQEGYRQIVVLPTHLISGSEFQKIGDAVEEFRNAFGSIVTGKPLLESEERRRLIAQTFLRETALNKDELLVLVGHGGKGTEKEVFARLEKVLEQLGGQRAIVDTVENVGNRVRQLGEEKVKLIPLLLTSGKHALKDIAGRQENSVVSMLCQAGCEVEVVEKSLGEYTAIRKVYVDQLQRLICEAG